jgi:hypothetical protein
MSNLYQSSAPFEVILAIRTWAVWHRSKVVCVILTVTMLGNLVVQCVFTSFSTLGVNSMFAWIRYRLRVSRPTIKIIFRIPCIQGSGDVILDYSGSDSVGHICRTATWDWSESKLVSIVCFFYVIPPSLIGCSRSYTYDNQCYQVV